jgi:hypothetical protein
MAEAKTVNAADLELIHAKIPTSSSTTTATFVIYVRA